MSEREPERCAWVGAEPLYLAYHDQEWGVPERDSRVLWEHLVLEGFQAGLSWITVLRKRDRFRTMFAGFAPERVARFDAADVERLLADPGIIRSRAKIEATIGNARAYLAMREAGLEFSAFVWALAGGGPVQNAWSERHAVPAETPLARDVSKALKAQGFKFVGPVTVYAWMQAVGLVNDHLVQCFRHEEVRRLGWGHRRGPR